MCVHTQLKVTELEAQGRRDNLNSFLQTPQSIYTFATKKNVKSHPKTFLD